MSLEVRIRHRFAGFALEAEFTAQPGLTVLFGPSGSGKSTIVDAVAGLFRPDHALIRADGRVLTDTDAHIFVPPHRRRAGYVFQQGRLFPHLSVRRNLTYGSRKGGADFAQVVGMLGIGHLLDRAPAALSGGERSRVAIGRALLAQPLLMLADEPLAALDDARKAEILPYFERLRDEARVPILYVSHSIPEVTRLATTVVALRAGRVIAQGTPSEVLGQGALGGDAGAIIDARVRRHHDDGLTELVAGDVPLWVPRVAAAPGTALRLRVGARDVVLSRDRPTGLSALNIMPGRIAGMRDAPDGSVMVRLDLGQDALIARITRRSAHAMGLAVGQDCHAILKSVAVHGSDIAPAPG
ncbi:molybdenum ABC transporter ATP-binding protein [Paracoccus zeaxanthinifaciens]|uniref:molybdenum ABC transporter ATP-binding protein n=1 Tax=Paracoccus zeaxanthinifaciens TaxID=187400 RepID=UPI0003B58C53|nr:molybdenum ABC transporter ATP-binding protein [Paracoccus zeaxanthinifaciens]